KLSHSHDHDRRLAQVCTALDGFLERVDGVATRPHLHLLHVLAKLFNPCRYLAVLRDVVCSPVERGPAHIVNFISRGPIRIGVGKPVNYGLSKCLLLWCDSSSSHFDTVIYSVFGVVRTCSQFSAKNVVSQQAEAQKLYTPSQSA